MQNRRAFLFLILAIVLGVSAAFTARRWIEAQARAPLADKPTTQPVAVVRADVSVGSALNEREVITVEWPIEFVPEGAFTKPAQVAGRVLRRPLASGEPILESSLLEEGARGGLVSVIDPTLRAISVKVDPVVGVAGFVVPGSHVDVLVTVRRMDREQALPYSKTILQDVKVLATDQKLEEAKNGDPELVQVVTLEVSPEQAQRLTFAAHEGKLQLALRNPGDREIVETTSVGVGDVLGHRKVAVVRKRAVAGPRPNVEVIKGSQLSVQSF